MYLCIFMYTTWVHMGLHFPGVVLISFLGLFIELPSTNSNEAMKRFFSTILKHEPQ